MEEYGEDEGNGNGNGNGFDFLRVLPAHATIEDIALLPIPDLNALSGNGYGYGKAGQKRGDGRSSKGWGAGYYEGGVITAKDYIDEQSEREFQ